MMYEDNIGFIFRRRKDTMYKQETKALARGKLGNIEQWNNQTRHRRRAVRQRSGAVERGQV